jgi:hypothetical protein
MFGGVPVAHARDVARHWVLREGTALPGFAGAFFVGSITRLAPTATLPFTSDVDVKVIVDVSELPRKIGKFLVDGVLLDVSFVSADVLWSPERVLGDCILAGSVRSSQRIADPSGLLAATQAVVSVEFARAPWVRRRCGHARDRVLDRSRGVRRDDPLPDQVIAWVFLAGAMTHLLLVAGLRDLTVRRCYVAVRELLAEHGRADVHETLLELLGCQRMTPRRVEYHSGALARAFDAATAVADAPFVFRTDISQAARRVAVDGSRELIAGGAHREAVFWMVATYAKAQKLLAHGAEPAMRDAAEVGLRELLADLAIPAFADLERRVRWIEHTLPDIWRVAEDIIAANPEAL